MGKLNTLNGIVAPVLVLNDTDAMTADAPHRWPGFVKSYTHKARDPLVKQQIIQMVLNGAGMRDTARVLGVNRNTVSAQFKKK